MYRNILLKQINMYTLAVKNEQLAVLQQLPLLLAMSRLVILAGEFNLIIDADGGADSKLSSHVQIPDGNENIKELKRDYTDWRTVKPIFESPVDYESKRETEKTVQTPENMQNLLLLQTMGVNVKEDLQEVKSQQASLFASGVSKIIYRSRVRTTEQDEMCSRLFFQKL
eukprot:g23006.t1